MPALSEWSIRDFIAQLESGHDVGDGRTDVDTASLIARAPELGSSDIEDCLVDGPHGEIPIRIYTPSAPSGVGLVWVHGGAFVGGDLESPEANWTSLALAAGGTTVVSVDYRKALRGVRFPVPSDDVLAAWNWVVGESARLGIRPGLLHLGGASAGANLAAGVVKRLRDAQELLPSTLLLIYPTLHFELPAPSPAAAQALVRVNPIERFPPHEMRAMNLQFVGLEALATNPYAFPASGDLAELPPVLVITSDADDLRSSGEAFAHQLAKDGGEVALMNEPGSVHGHLDRPFAPEARSTIRRMQRWLSR